MVTLLLDDETAARLQAIADLQNRTPADMLRDLIAQYDATQPVGNPNWLKQMAEMIEEHTDIVWKDEPDLSERSREILNNEFADYLINWMQQNDSSNTKSDWVKLFTYSAKCLLL